MSGLLAVVEGVAVIAVACAAVVLLVRAARRWLGPDESGRPAVEGGDDGGTNPYAGGPSAGGVYGLASSQPGIGPYAATDARTDDGADGSDPESFPDPLGAFDCRNPWRCADCDPFGTAD